MNQKLSTMTKIPFIRLTIKRANRRKGGSKTLIFELKSVYVIDTAWAVGITRSIATA